MATQGLVTVRTRGKVRMKIVAGVDGMKASAVAASIREMNRVPSLQEAYDLAIRLNFGTPRDLVVIDEETSLFEGDEPPNKRYRRTFRRPSFNPRWRYGLADHVEIVDL